MNAILDVAPEAEFETLDPDAGLREQLDLDSMDFLDIVMELRKRFNIEVPEKDYEHLATLAGCITYLQPLLKDRLAAS